MTAAVEGTFDTGSQQWQWQLAERYVYTPYGEASVYDANWANPAAPTDDGPLYCGYFFDAETALYNVRWRIYHSTLSLWLTRDLIAADINLYRYCGNAPLHKADPSGLIVRIVESAAPGAHLIFDAKGTQDGLTSNSTVLVNPRVARLAETVS